MLILDRVCKILLMYNVYPIEILLDVLPPLLLTLPIGASLVVDCPRVPSTFSSLDGASLPELIFVTNITNYIRGEISAFHV